MKSNLFLYGAVVGLVALVSGCASPARTDQMSVAGQPSQRIAETHLRNNLAIRDVTGGKETNPMWKSNIGSSEFEQALEISLRAVGLLADRQAGLYMLTAHLESVDQPIMGLDMTVTASVSYVVSERATGKNVFKRTFVVPYTASFGDAFMGIERLRLANEGAIRANITQLIDELFRLKIGSVAMK